MIRIKGLDQADIQTKTAVTVGKFDGIHRGHELLTRRIVSLKADGFKACVVTFDEPPRVLLEGASDHVLITSEERAAMFEKEGVDYLVECVFDSTLMHMEPEAFVDTLLTKLGMGYMVVGSDFTFGYRGRGDTRLLEELSRKKNFQLTVEEKLRENGEDISSTLIRSRITDGRIAEADELLGYPYFIEGEVVHGRHLGHSIGVPTINIIPPACKLLPAYGVYATLVYVGDRVYQSMTDVGVKPTVQGGGQTGIETHIFHFDQNLYGKRVKVTFLEHMRPEIRFESLDALRSQLMEDRQNVMRYFRRRQHMDE